MKKKLEKLSDQFKEHKLTPQRRVVLEVLLENTGQHLSAEELYSLTKSKDPEIGLATIYRTLDLLEELNILHKLNFGDGRSRYEFSQVQSHHHHHHLICLNCNQIMEVKQDLLHHLEDLIEREHGFAIVDHRVQFYGHCNSCRREREQERNERKDQD